MFCCLFVKNFISWELGVFGWGVKEGKIFHEWVPCVKLCTELIHKSFSPIFTPNQTYLSCFWKVNWVLCHNIAFCWLNSFDSGILQLILTYCSTLHVTLSTFHIPKLLSDLLSLSMSVNLWFLLGIYSVGKGIGELFKHMFCFYIFSWLF